MNGTKSKTLATWIALIGGGLGLHRFYLHGLGNLLGWLHPLLTLLGVFGLQRVQQFGQDDRLAWLLLPLGGLSLSAAMLQAIVYGLSSDAKWDARHNAGRTGTPASGWGAVIGVVLALLLGATALLSTITVSFQRYFESQVEAARQISQ
ncbi:MAG: hypothetical protein RJA44_1423 [Pseudomonadota bacterium]|jgi:hypothetical protein